MKKISIIAVLLCSLFLTGAELFVIKEGKSPYAIVYADKSSVPGIVNYNAIAADTLRGLLFHATKVRLPIYRESTFKNTHKAIFIGNTAAAKKAGLTPEKWQKCFPLLICAGQLQGNGYFS